MPKKYELKKAPVTTFRLMKSIINAKAECEKDKERALNELEAFRDIFKDKNHEEVKSDAMKGMVECLKLAKTSAGDVAKYYEQLIKLDKEHRADVRRVVLDNNKGGGQSATEKMFAELDLDDDDEEE